jgi:transcriptional regulator with XRE-family HTH domain
MAVERVAFHGLCDIKTYQTVLEKTGKMARTAVKNTLSEETEEAGGTMDRFIGQRLKVIRQLKDFTQKELIQATGLSVTQQVFSKYENGGVRIPATVLYVLANALDVQMEAFFPLAKGKTKVKAGQEMVVEKILSNSLARLKRIKQDCAEEVTALEVILQELDGKTANQL